ncbi:hypothetical protein [Hoeflea sp.]|uniref:hypothetical protein n=1 Tax=Hoeflea sp. TaxID=1940281 RepID=UPI001987A130|nr:hypothetical protein [Hoeflea sp.]MBC7282591.1 hypothetical protein [Hoeflea sp.]
MLGIASALFRWLGSGPLDRILSTVDKKISAETDREAIKGEIIKAHYASRGDYMRAGGFWLMIIFAIPLAVWFGAVVVYSILWCADCAYPQDWTIAALPAPLDEWAGMIIVSIFGVIGVTRFKR